MREIKFRALLDRTKYDSSYKHWFYSEEMGLGEFFLMVAKNNLDAQEYTGLKDKDGKEVYEGDIIAIGLTHKIVKAVIEWNDKEACFGCKWDSDTARVRKEVGMPNLPANLVSSGSPWGVSGNIYENPELLTTDK